MKKLIILPLLLLCTSLTYAQNSDSKILKNGFGIESFVGFATTDFSDDNFGLGLKVSNTWYFGNNDAWKPGLKANWFRFATYFGANELDLQIALPHVGFANAFEFTPNVGLELNLNVGYNIVGFFNDTGYYNYHAGYYDDFDDFVGGGIFLNPEIKFRYNILAVGLDVVLSKINEYSTQEYYNGSYYEYYRRDTPFSAVNISFGVKF